MNIILIDNNNIIFFSEKNFILQYKLYLFFNTFKNGKKETKKGENNK